MAITTNRNQDVDFSVELHDIAMSDRPIYDMGVILAYVQANYTPDQIYDQGELDDWALAHGYVKQE